MWDREVYEAMGRAWEGWGGIWGVWRAHEGWAGVWGDGQVACGSKIIFLSKII